MGSDLMGRVLGGDDKAGENTIALLRVLGRTATDI